MTSLMLYWAISERSYNITLKLKSCDISVNYNKRYSKIDNKVLRVYI